MFEFLRSVSRLGSSIILHRKLSLATKRQDASLQAIKAPQSSLVDQTLRYEVARRLSTSDGWQAVACEVTIRARCLQQLSAAGCGYQGQRLRESLYGQWPGLCCKSQASSARAR